MPIFTACQDDIIAGQTTQLSQSYKCYGIVTALVQNQNTELENFTFPSVLTATLSLQTLCQLG